MPSIPSSGLPIDEVLPALRDALRARRAVVLQAPPGAGKSTVVPLALLDEPWMQGKRLVMLEPRRLAARAVAQRMASTVGESVGRTVGYRMRSDTRVSRETRIEVVTEGVLTRMLQTDAALEGTAAVIFDEFHERSLQADLGLALTLDAQANLSPDLRLVVMSATLDGQAVARLLGDAPLVTASGRMFPVESRYAGQGAPVLPSSGFGGPHSQDSPERVVARIVQRALREEPGDVLVFLPGAGEIRRVQGLIEPSGDTRVLPLFGDLSAADQDEALAPSKRGKRRVVLATNIAETSLTIEGVRIVVDSGLVRRSVFDPSTGMSRLETQRISRASADQRQGRAGRLEPGVCYRAWSEGAHRSLAPQSPAEMLDADLAPLALELAGWGIVNPADLKWLDLPPTSMLASARDLLHRLGALDSAGRITAHGREMTRIGTHPRLAHMLLKARDLDCVGTAAHLAALLSERDLLRTSGPGSRDADIRTRLDILERESDAHRADRGTLQRVKRVASDLSRQISQDRRTSAASAPVSQQGLDALSKPTTDIGAGDAGRKRAVSTSLHDAGLLLAFAYPDRIAKRRGENRYTLANGRGAIFTDVQSLARQELIVAVDLDDRERDARILLAAPLDKADIEEHFAGHIVTAETVEWNDREQAVNARKVVRLDAVILEEKPLRNLPPGSTHAAMLQGVGSLGLQALPWTPETRDLQARMEFVRTLKRDDVRDWPEVNDEALLANLESWLTPWLDGITRRDHLSRLSLAEILRSLLAWEQQRQLDDFAPSHLTVPTGSSIRVDYLDESAPAVSVRLQEVFGLTETPRLGGNRVPVTFKLLSPARRPVQVTRDLASFWRGAYADVRKDLRGRYPRHYWPENPLEAEPTRGIRRPPR